MQVFSRMATPNRNIFGGQKQRRGRPLDQSPPQMPPAIPAGNVYSFRTAPGLAEESRFPSVAFRAAAGALSAAVSAANRR